MLRYKRSGTKRPGCNGSSSSKQVKKQVKEKPNGTNSSSSVETSEMCREWFEKGLEMGRKEAAQELASREQRSWQEAKEEKRRLDERERRLSDWQRRLAAEQELGQVNKKLEKQRVKVINGLRAQLQVQASKCTCKPPAAQ